MHKANETVFIWNEKYSRWHGTANGTVNRRCTSVSGEPTRGRALGQGFGQSDVPIFIAQPRRQRPDWDGCRDRNDGRRDLHWDLLWEQPSQRALHAAIYSPDYEIMLLYGGEGLGAGQVTSARATIRSQTSYLSLSMTALALLSPALLALLLFLLCPRSSSRSI